MGTRRQTIEKIISSEKFNLEQIKMFVDQVTPDGESQSESRDFTQWLKRLKAVISIYETLTDERYQTSQLSMH